MSALRLPEAIRKSLNFKAMIKVSKFVSLLFVLLAFANCKTNESFFGGSIIQINNQKSEKKLASMVSVVDVIELQKSAEEKAPNVNQVLFGKNEIYILDTETDFHSVFAYNKHDGSFIRKVGQQWDGSNPYESLRDICIDEKGELTLLSDAKGAFFNYLEEKTNPEVIKNGIIGDQLVRDNNDGYVVYNELSETEVSKNYRLLFFDKSGNLTGRSQSYNPILENAAYDFTGFLRKGGDDIWYSPPFCDTVYSIKGKKVIPSYLVDFGEYKIPEIVREKKIDPSQSELFGKGFLNEWFFKTGNFVQFEYQLQDKVCHGIFNEGTNEFFAIHNFPKDPASLLMSRGTIMPKSNEEFILILRDFQLNSLKKDKNFRIEDFENYSPGLGKIVENAKNHLIITMRFN
jgi:hypothetical protein